MSKLIKRQVEEVRSICKGLGIADHHIDNIINTIRAGLPLQDESSPLPTDIVTGFQPIDYLISPVKNNTRIHIYGRAGSAKTAIIAHVVSAIIAKFNTEVLWLDSTFKLSHKFFKKFKIGDQLKFLQTSYIDNVISDMILSGRFRLIVIDDVASFRKGSSTQLERILYYCKIYKIMVLLANQVRVVPKTGMVYSSRQELLTSYDLTLRTMKYRLHYEHKYNDYDVKLEYHRGTGRMDGQSVVIPITTSGHIKKDLMDARLGRMAKVAGFEDFDTYMFDRLAKFDQ